MPRKEFRVPTAVDPEDVSVVENALRQLPGVDEVLFHPETKRITIQWADPTTWNDIESKLDVLGYAVADD